MSYRIIVFLIIIFSYPGCFAQEKFFTAFWNVENLFDTIDQPDVDDAEFLPTSRKTVG
jgi:hypothetical protein